MITAPISTTDKLRLAELYYYEILDTPPEDAFNEITLLATQICRTKICALSFIDENRQWIKASLGLPFNEINRQISFCGHTIQNNDVMEVPNAQEDIRFHNNPLVTDKKIKFYAGVPLINQRGYKLGTLSVFDTKARTLSDSQKTSLKLLAKQVIRLLELHVKNKELMVADELQKKVALAIEDDVRTPVRMLKRMLQTQHEKRIPVTARQEVLANNVDKILSRLDNLVEWNNIQSKINTPSVTLTNVRTLADECIASLDSGMRENVFINNIDSGLNLYVDKSAMEFILRNLLYNANRYTDHGAIALYQYSHDNTFYFTVQDTGAGIEMNKINVILDETNPYFINSSSNTQKDGLGLKLIRDYLRSTGNELNITSAPGKGTAVSFSIKAVA